MALSDDYSKRMQKEMGTSLSYRHEDGMNYSKPFPRLFVGSCPQNANDIDRLQKEGVDIIVCLQQDSDMAYFNLDLAPIKARAEEVGIQHVRLPMHDFDPISLRRSLPSACKQLVNEMSIKTDSQAYVHCTAGLGRAPGLALTYMFWVDGCCLDEAYKTLFAGRRCHPQIGMIRAATCDVLGGHEGGKVKVRLAIHRKGAQIVEIAGLDIGWKNRLRLEGNDDGEFSVEKEVPPGRYQYKFIVDGDWQPNLDLPTVDDNGNVNNVLDVAADFSENSVDAERRARIMSQGGRPTKDELETLRSYLGCSKATGKGTGKGGYQEKP